MLKVELNADGKAVIPKLQNKSTKKSASLMMNWLKPASKLEKAGGGEGNKRTYF